MRPVVLCILDGWGLSPTREGNAVALGATPNFDRIWETCPHATLAAHGPDVGLPEGQMGNSEVGHMNIGAGRVVWMDLPRIDNAIADGSFAANEALRQFVAALKESGGTAHLAGLASPGRRACAPAADRGGGGGDRRGRGAGGGACLPRRPRRAAEERAGADRGAGGGPARGGADRDGLGALLRHGPRQALGAGRRGAGGDRARRGRARGERRGGDRGGLRARRDRRVRAADGDRRLSRARRTGTGSSSPTSAPTGRGKSSRRWSIRSSTASRWSGGRSGRRCSGWCSIPRRWTR